MLCEIHDAFYTRGHQRRAMDRTCDASSDSWQLSQNMLVALTTNYNSDPNIVSKIENIFERDTSSKLLEADPNVYY